MKVIEIRGAEVVETLSKEVESLGIRNGAITLIGGVDSFRISNITSEDATKSIVTDYDVPGELTGTGEVTDGEVHVHVVCGVEGGTARAGHLHAAQVGTWFVRAYVTPLE